MIQNWGSVPVGEKLVEGVKSGAIYKANTASRNKGRHNCSSLGRCGAPGAWTPGNVAWDDGSAICVPRHGRDTL